MIDMGVRQDDCVDFADRKWQRPVLFRRITSLALEHAAVEQDGMSVYVQDVAGAGYFSRSSRKCYLQPILSLCHSAALKKDDQAMFVLRHERRFPSTPAPLVQKVG